MLVLGRKVSQKTVVTHKSGDVLEIIITRVEINRETGGFKINVGFHEPNGTRNFEIHRPERASGPRERDELGTQEVGTLRRLANDPNPTEGVLDWIPTRLPRPGDSPREHEKTKAERDAETAASYAECKRVFKEEVAREEAAFERRTGIRLADVRSEATRDQTRLVESLDERRKARRID